MSFLQDLFGKKRASNAVEENSRTHSGDGKPDPGSASGVLDARLVEDIVASLRQKPPTKDAYHVVLFGDRPLTAKLQGESILCFTRKVKAEEFMKKYQDTYHCTKPLAALALGQVSELWAMLNNKARDSDYEPPYGLVINFNYGGQPYNTYGSDDLKRIGLNGLQKGLGALPK